MPNPTYELKSMVIGKMKERPHFCKTRRQYTRRKLQRIIGIKNKRYLTRPMRLRIKFFTKAVSNYTLYAYIANNK